RDPVRDFQIIQGELRAFSETLTTKPEFVVATKLDATTDHERLDRLREFAEAHGLLFFAISSATGEGVQLLVRAMADALDRLPRPQQPHAENIPVVELGVASEENTSETVPHPEKR
ncbi:MAG TPA: hypothetical protein VNF00_04965, partial [Candidatus Acidoferrales bacterium]|nr:hypothetical protein [Candidatus Acidoferrales bacterium]